MPVVSAPMTREGTEPGVDHVTAEQKAAIYKGMSEVLRDVLGKPADWICGRRVAEYRAKMAAALVAMLPAELQAAR